MARYCFYCGRELKPGEKCGCRTASQQDQPQTAQASQNPKPDKARVSRQNSLFRRIVRFFNPFAGQTQKTQRVRSTAAPKAKKTGQPFRLSQNDRQVWHQVVALLTRPADALSSVSQAGGALLPFVLLLLLGLAGGLFLIIGIRQPQLQMILSLNTATATAGSVRQSDLFLLIQGFGMSLSFALLLVLTYHLALRTVFQTVFGLSRLLTALSPAFLYLALFLIAALLVLPGSVFSAFMILVAGFAVSAITQFLVMRHLTRFDDNRCFYLVALVLFIATGILALLLNLSLPILNALLDQSVVI